MDLLRLPPALRRNALFASIRHLTSQTHLESPSLGLLTLSSSTLNQYSLSIPPNTAQLKYAHTFFTASPPPLLFSSPHFRSLPPSPIPEVAFLGRSNVGKSSLLNALFGRPTLRPAHVSKHPGRTRTMNGFGVLGFGEMGPEPKQGEREARWKRFPRGGGCVVLDMPGYGAGGREEWGREVLKYLEGRKQLRRCFVLVDAGHGLKTSDVQLLAHLRRRGINHQLVLSKVDKILHPGSKAPAPRSLNNRLLKLKGVCAGIQARLDEEAGMGAGSMQDMLCTSAEKGLEAGNKGRRLGIDELRWAVLAACGLECDEMGQRRKAQVYDMPRAQEDEEEGN
jgi:GTP-binding protein